MIEQPGGEAAESSENVENAVDSKVSETTVDSDARVLDDEQIKEALATRKIGESDYHIVAELAACDRNELIALYHNFFSGHTSVSDPKNVFLARIKNQLESHAKQLERAQNTGDEYSAGYLEQRVRIDKGMFALVDRYDTYAANHIARALENWRP